MKLAVLLKLIRASVGPICRQYVLGNSRQVKRKPTCGLNVQHIVLFYSLHHPSINKFFQLYQNDLNAALPLVLY